MLARVASLFVAVGLGSQVMAADPPMTKIVARMDILGVAGDPIPAKPKTIYLAGDKYARVEEGADVVANTISVIITSEPDSWIIDLATKTGRHEIDPGPEFVTRAPIFWSASGKPEPEFDELEFGAEMKFFGGGRAREIKSRTIDGQTYKALSIKTGPHEAILYLDPKTEKPFQIDLIKFERHVSSVRYLSYETGLPFDAALFQPPADVEIAK